ncbi:amidohydrolase family protein [Photobacterium rosenbergii]|uniref:Amidohydrolase family protein n=1 Tax=Photobacterium rosenbergii TaxID=294936 RepID=A0ABU3ZHN1_9GAMM|nr:amidohydrolase family protein [Photobacterium rosenbergii]MDV5169635.1 amidohydrolase family protein [Photobacterium rosenbergii]
MKPQKLFTSTVIAAVLAASPMAYATEEDTVQRTLIKNANIFDGTSDKLTSSMSVLIEDNKIAKISKSIPATSDMMVIDAAGRTMSPGFIDAHVHLTWNTGMWEFMDSPGTYIGALALKEAENTLMRGFTTVRDTGGPSLGPKKAIDQGHFPGPRIYSAEAAIGMTAGHGDFRTLNTAPRQFGGPALTELEIHGGAIMADGVPEVLTASREQMRKGAHFLKIFSGGAVSGLRDPLDIMEYSMEELKAAAGEADRWNTYVAVHAYTDRAVRESLEAGFLSIEHANMLTEETMKLAAEKGAFISAQTGFFLGPVPAHFNEQQAARQIEAAEGLDTMMKMAKKYNVDVGFGTDFIGSFEAKALQNQEFTNRLKWFTPAEIMQQATSVNTRVLEMTGPRNPYPGKLGVIEEGAYADILLINGNPLKDISILTNPEENLALIMKDGEIFKNTIN